MNKEISNIQKQFWTLSKLMANNCAYNIVSAVKIEGLLDVEKIKQSWGSVFNRTSSFSTVFQLLNGVPYMEKQENIACPWEFYQVKDTMEAELLIQKMANKPFNLGKDIPVKAFLISVDPTLNYFLILQHHIITDLYSKNLLSSFISEFYNTGQCKTIFTEYDCTENAEQTEKQNAFWKKYLSTSVESLHLPPGKFERSVFNGSGSTYYGKLSTSVYQKIVKMETENLFQPFLIFLTAYAVLLSKLSGQKDFFIGVPFPNRRDGNRINMYGPFVNILPLHITIDSNEKLSSLYKQIRMQMLLLHRNQETPFYNIQKHYSGIRDNKIPFFLQAGFTKEEPFSLNLDNLVCTSMDIRPAGTQMDLFFTFWKEEDTFKYRWEFNTQAFNNTQIKSWESSYLQIIDKLINNADQSVSELSCIGNKDKEDLSGIFSKNKRDYPLSTPFYSHLIAGYIKYSENTAIKDGKRILSYREFSNLVKKYSSYLNIKAGTGAVIAVVLDRSIDRTVFIHAIICSGNSYLPVDPNWPKDRIKYILSNAKVTITISDSMFRTRIPDNEQTILIEELNNLEVPEEFIGIDTLPDHPIAVIYTSGSTGEPKGVSISGKGITNRLFWMQETFPIGPLDTLIHKVPFTFDVSMWELFWPFLTGATLFIPNPLKHLDDNYLENVILKEKISYIHFVPSLLKKFLYNISEYSFPMLRGVICSGEVLEVSLLKRFYNKFPNTPLFNLYGPTEASIDVTFWNCSLEDALLDRIPIGYPIANTGIYILDKENHLCPPFVRGEIAISGVNLANGYINNNELTNNSFIKGDWGWGEETIYLTGDIGYYHGDCRVEYIGREDSQIKINGIRIELSEIERRLEKLSYINSAIVLKNNQHNLNVELSAYLILLNMVDTGKIIADLAEFLPGYMIPSHFYFFDQFPMLGNGKIDKKQLLSYNSTIIPLNNLEDIKIKVEESNQRKGIRRMSRRNINS